MPPDLRADHRGARRGGAAVAVAGPQAQATAADATDAGASPREIRRAADARLAVAARRGDDDAFRELVERYQKQVYWIAYDILLDAEEARDAAQETFIRVHAALHAFDPTRDFLNWLYRIARNIAIDAYRRRRRRAVPVEGLGALEQGAADPVDAAPPPPPSSHGESLELKERVRLVLAELPLEYRLALTLREFHDRSPREIAELTDCTYPTARWRLHRARALFRKAWERRFGAATPPEVTS